MHARNLSLAKTQLLGEPIGDRRGLADILHDLARHPELSDLSQDWVNPASRAHRTLRAVSAGARATGGGDAAMWVWMAIRIRMSRRTESGPRDLRESRFSERHER